MVLNMNPYRESSPNSPANEESPARDDEIVLVWLWFFLGCLLVVADVSQPEPWGVAFSLGMLVLIFAIGRLWQHLRIRWRMRSLRF